jgi:catechol-2,3-dioxygenase
VGSSPTCSRRWRKLAWTVHVALDQRVSQGLYVSDPDGNLIELYADADPELWRRDATLVANPIHSPSDRSDRPVDMTDAALDELQQRTVPGAVGSPLGHWSSYES